MKERGEKEEKHVNAVRVLMKTVLLLCCLAAATALGGEEPVLRMSTTTSTQASGLLDVLLPAFTTETGIRVKVIAKGTGAAIRDGMDGNVDLIFVHAKEREERFVRQGYGVRRYAVMHNDFVILGPSSDPAGIRGMEDAAAALRRIAAARAPFVSRGDDSGTHTREQQLWRATGLPLATVVQPLVSKGRRQEVEYAVPRDAGGWYLSIGQGMGRTLTMADERRAYTLADRGTYIKYRFGRKVPVDLEVLCQGDPRLLNPYGIIPVNPHRYPDVHYDLAMRFVRWLVSARGQALISGYRLFGRQLFYPDALK